MVGKNKTPALGVINVAERRAPQYLNLQFSEAAQEMVAWIGSHYPHYDIHKLFEMAFALQQEAWLSHDEGGQTYVERKGSDTPLSLMASIGDTHAEWKKALAEIPPQNVRTASTTLAAQMLNKKTALDIDGTTMFDLRVMRQRRGDATNQDTIEFGLAYMALCMAHSLGKDKSVCATFPVSMQHLPKIQQEKLINFGIS